MKDCRTLEFKKWILPKTESIFSVNDSNLTIGYFDFIAVKKIEGDQDNPLEIYIKQKENSKKELFISSSYDDYKNKNDNRNFSTQLLLLFTDVSDVECLDKAVYLQNKVEKFWSEPSLLRFYSLLHIKNGSRIDEVYKVVKQINNAFSIYNNSNGYNAVCYFSLDYSDIIICTKNISITDFSKALFNLNYNSKVKTIRDSFSLISIDHNIIKSIINELPDNYSSLNDEITKKLQEMGCDDKFLSEYFTASFNIGIQNFNLFVSLTSKLDESNIKYEKYKLIGRHDVSIYNEKANIVWLLIIQFFIDEFTVNDKENEYNENNILFNCESFIRVPFETDERYFDSKLQNNPDEVKRYTHAMNDMDYKIGAYINQYISHLKKEESFNTIHISPIIALRDSLLELLKNGFAEDFVLCVYESFLSFLNYMINKIDGNYAHDRYFDKVFNAFFTNVNAITNSAMHSDRQFVQSPSFNPVFYDVPPKLMAYYTAITHKICDILMTNVDLNNKCRYSFIFRPSFDTNINVVRYSYREAAPCDRMLAVTMNELDLYYPCSVIKQICHEIAHHVGDGNRNRTERKNCIVQSMLFLLAFDFLKTYFKKQIKEDAIIFWVQEVMINLSRQSFYNTNIEYLSNLRNIVYQCVLYMYVNDDIKSCNRKMFVNLDGISEVEVAILLNDFNDYLRFFAQTLLDKNSYNDNKISLLFEALMTIYSELYADFQMILVLDLSLDEYIEMFDDFYNDIIEMREREDIYYRILNVVMFFVFNGKWCVKDNSKGIGKAKCILSDIKSYINYYNDLNAFLEYASTMYCNNNLAKVVHDIKKYEDSDWCGHNYLCFLIQRYLFMVYKNSQENYQSKDKDDSIKSIRNQMNILKSFDKSIDVFCAIQKANDDYADRLYRMQDDLDT